ncbi:MAG TPA: type II secretion system protein [Candidatus Nanoarchaeia archaeon]
MKITSIKNKGFTLIELIVVIAIISILVGIVVFVIDPEGMIDRSNDTKDRTELNQVKTSLELYYNDHDEYPADSGDLEPTYMKQVPSGIDYGVSGDGQDYDAGISIRRSGQVDADSVSKCGTELASGEYMICPD